MLARTLREPVYTFKKGSQEKLWKFCRLFRCDGHILAYMHMFTFFLSAACIFYQLFPKRLHLFYERFCHYLSRSLKLESSLRERPKAEQQQIPLFLQRKKSVAGKENMTCSGSAKKYHLCNTKVSSRYPKRKTNGEHHSSVPIACSKC